MYLEAAPPGSGSMEALVGNFAERSLTFAPGFGGVGRCPPGNGTVPPEGLGVGMVTVPLTGLLPGTETTSPGEELSGNGTAPPDG